MLRTTPTLGPLVLLALLTSLVGAQLDVRIMPGFPNAPHQDPLDRTAVRPGTPFLVWGNVAGGIPVPAGTTYSWSFSPNPNVQVVDDGSLTGPVTDSRFIYEEVTFNLLNNSTAEFLDATLFVDDGTGNTGTRFVGLVIIDPLAPQSDTALEALAIDVNISIQDGLRWLYLNQLSNGSWNASTIAGNHPCPGTGFVAWAFQNQGHRVTNDFTEDIYAETVQRALDYIFTQGQVLTNVTAPNGPLGVSDMNNDGMTANLCPGGDSGYASPIAAAAIVASAAPSRVINNAASPFNGWTYGRLLENFIDWSGQTQGTNNGGWDYNPANTSGRSDMSINSWHYVALEGAETAFGIDVPDWIIINAERTLVSHQSVSEGAFGYISTTQCTGGTLNRFATSGGGLSGLRLVEFESAPQGTLITAAPGPLNTIAAKRQAALDWIGTNFGYASPGNYCQGHKGNFYGMWTLARALRLTAQALSLPKVTLVNATVNFDWETGEENGSGNLAGPNTDREGYFPWLLRNQQNTGAPSARGRWQNGTFVGATMETAMAVLILTPRVFLDLTNPPTLTVTVGGQPQNCPVNIPASESVSITFDLTATDIDPGDVMTLTATGVPPGAIHTPPLPAMGGTPLQVNFSWTPLPSQVGIYQIIYTVTDSTMLSTTCVVDIAVGTCQLLVGVLPEESPITRTVTLHLVPQVWFPVTMEQIPNFFIGDPALQGATFRAQVFMNNPFVFPSNPFQCSPCLEVTIGSPRVTVIGVGDIDIWPVGLPSDQWFTIGFDVF